LESASEESAAEESAAEESAAEEVVAVDSVLPPQATSAVEAIARVASSASVLVSLLIGNFLLKIYLLYYLV
jgi:hypothetical protein